MHEKISPVDIIIVGGGPRGLSALESLYVEAGAFGVVPTCIVVEPSAHPGAGPVYSPDQPDTNWLNVSERCIGIDPRPQARFENFTVPAFPDYQGWSGFSEKDNNDTEIDRFPLRSEMGRYLTERFESIALVLRKEVLLTVLRAEAVSLKIEGNGVTVILLGGQKVTGREVVLCIGHQPTELDDQIANWSKRAGELDGSVLYTQPYPAERLTQEMEDVNDQRFAVRGFGLAMVDVVRALTEGRGGNFELSDRATRAMEYRSSGREPSSILAFSLDGLPMAPKPLNREIDSYYQPNDSQLWEYRRALGESIAGGNLDSTEFLIGAIAPIVVDKYLSLGNRAMVHDYTFHDLQTLVSQWLCDGRFGHRLIVSRIMPAARAMRKFVGMATGHKAASLDYCIGHVWRHCQPTMYGALSFAPLNDRLIADIVELDERLKRYSYGPPVDSLQQVLALVDSGTLDLGFVNNPDIALDANGWTFKKGNRSTTANMMVNSVLDGPQILKAASPLVKGLLGKSGVEAVHDKLGVSTGKDALMRSHSDNAEIPIAMMGRLAKGTLIGVDAIAECFGDRSGYWARGVLGRMRPNGR